MSRELHAMGAQMQDVFEPWSMHLDMLEGLVAQTIDRGWSEEQARRIVAASFGGRPEGSEDD